VEVVIIAVFYSVYSFIRDLHGTNAGSVERATRNAHRIIRLERDLHIFDEQPIQHTFLHLHGFVSFLDDYYGSAHFIAVAGVLIWLFFAQPKRYRRWRNTLAVCTALALVGFAFFPVLPPRLLPYGEYHIVDTLKVIGGLWNFSSGPANDVSNQYAAMPSLHTAWSTWCALAVASACRSWWAKIAVFLYPALTVFCIVVTGNHYFADAAGGLLTLAAAYAVARLVTGRLPPLHRRSAEDRQPDPVGV
jgi:membrane-associated phospholipid phosphatase